MGQSQDKTFSSEFSIPGIENLLCWGSPKASETTEFRAQDSKKQPVFALYLAWVFLCMGSHIWECISQKYTREIWSSFSTKPQALSQLYLMLDIRLELAVNDKKSNQHLWRVTERSSMIWSTKNCFLHILSGRTIEMVTNIVIGTEVQYGLKDDVMYLYCNNSGNT